MARTYAKVLVTIWADDDFRTLTDGAQALYLRLLTSPTLNLAGVADWRPKRLAPFTKDMTADVVEHYATELAHKRYIVVDEDTEEVLIRSFVKHDGVMKNAKVAAGFAKEYAGTASRTIRGVIVHELTRLRNDSPEYPGWQIVGPIMTENEGLDPWQISPFTSPIPATDSALPDTPSHALSHALSDRQSDRQREGLCHIQQPVTSNLQPTTSNPRKSPDGDPSTRKNHVYPPEFETFYAAYPRKAGKQAALKAWKKALDLVDNETLTEAASRFAADPNREEQFTPHPATWLNDGRWDDDPLPAPSHRHPQDGDRFDDWERAAQLVNTQHLRAIEGGTR